LEERVEGSYVDKEINAVKAMLARDYLTTGTKIPKSIERVMSQLNSTWKNIIWIK